MRRLLAVIAGLALVAAVALVVVQLSAEDPIDRDIEADAWVLVGVAPGERGLLVRAVRELSVCEENEASATRAGDGSIQVTVRRILDGCAGPQIALAELPVTLTVPIPGGGALRGEVIGGPAYRGVGAPSSQPQDLVSVPNVVGLAPDVATAVVEANDLRVELDGEPNGFVRAQEPRGDEKIPLDEKGTTDAVVTLR